MTAGEIDLPVFPEAARNVIAACDREDGDMRGLAELVRRDPVMSAQFLRLANSPAFGCRSPIVSLPQALARLGTSQTRQIALLITCKARVFACAARKDEALRLRARAVATALWAQEIARARRLNVEEAFLCGLLADVAMPALWQLAADLDKTSSPSGSASDVDVVVARLHHTVGADVAVLWGLPARVGATIRLHHASPETIALAGGGASLEGTVAVVQLADALAARSAAGETCDLAAIQAHPSVATLSLYGPELDALLGRRDVVVDAVRASS